MTLEEANAYMEKKEHCAELRTIIKEIKRAAEPEFTAKREQELKRREEELFPLERSFDKYLETVEDGLAQAVLHLRFSRGMLWKDVAESLGGGNTPDSVKKICYRHFEREAKGKNGAKAEQKKVLS